MAELTTITRFLNKELNIRKIKDSSRNGLQVRGKSEVSKIGVAVDACIEVFKKAKRKKCDLVVVHHGLFWKGKKRDDILEKRVSFLKKNKISLYAAHAPLDIHINYGNNAELARILGARNLRKFAFYKGVYYGYWGVIKLSSLKSVVNKYNKKLNTKSLVMNFGKKRIKNVGFCSGAGWYMLNEAKKKNLDLFVLGEITHMNYHKVKELGLNLIVPGHYKTEILGVKALMRLLKQKFKIRTEFIDAPTGL